MGTLVVNWNPSGYYLGEPVVIEADHGDGWVTCRWPNGKVFKHLRSQLTKTPWGEPVDG
jgi:hypothetical protein